MASRRADRVSMFLPVKVRDFMLDQIHEGTSRDISETGVQVLMPDLLTRGEVYRLTFSFPGVKALIQTQARCVRNLDLMPLPGEGGTSLSGFHFISMVEPIRESLAASIRDIAGGIFDFLADHEPFAGIKEDALAELAGCCRRLELAEGETLPGEVDLMSSFIIVRSGLVKFYKPGFRQGWERAFVGTRGCVLGEQSLLEDRPHGFRIHALGASELLLVSPHSYSFIKKEHPRAAQSFRRIMEKIAKRRRRGQYSPLAPLGLDPAVPLI